MYDNKLVCERYNKVLYALQEQACSQLTNEQIQQKELVNYFVHQTRLFLSQRLEITHIGLKEMEEQRNFLAGCLSSYRDEVCFYFTHNDNSCYFQAQYICIKHKEHEFRINLSKSDAWYTAHQELVTLFKEARNYLRYQIDNYQINMILNSEGMKEFKQGNKTVVPEIEIKAPGENVFSLNFKKMLGISEKKNLAK